MTLTLPLDKEDIAAIQRINNLTDSSLQDLLAGLRTAPVVRDWEDMAKEIAPKVRSLAIGDLTIILEGLSTLYYLREIADVTPEKFLDDLISDVQKMEGDGLELADEAVKAVRRRFTALLDVEPLSIVAKGIRLQREASFLYCDSRVLTDIRSVFGNEVGRPAAAVITHTLKLGYHEGHHANHKEFYVALDTDDLESLASAIDRALSKEKALRELLVETRLPNLTI